MRIAKTISANLDFNTFKFLSSSSEIQRVQTQAGGLDLSPPCSADNDIDLRPDIPEPKTGQTDQQPDLDTQMLRDRGTMVRHRFFLQVSRVLDTLELAVVAYDFRAGQAGERRIRWDFSHRSLSFSLTWCCDRLQELESHTSAEGGRNSQRFLTLVAGASHADRQHRVASRAAAAHRVRPQLHQVVRANRGGQISVGIYKFTTVDDRVVLSCDST